MLCILNSPSLNNRLDVFFQCLIFKRDTVRCGIAWSWGSSIWDPFFSSLSWSLAFYTSPTVQGFLVARLVKNPLAMRETRVWSLGWEDPLEKGMATHSSILAWRSPWTVSPWDCKELDMTKRLLLHFHFFPTVQESYVFSEVSSAGIFWKFFKDVHSNWSTVSIVLIFICFSPILIWSICSSPFFL